MEISIAHQQMEAAVSLIIGLGTGVVYDFSGVLRRRFILKVFTYLFDLIYCVALGGVYFLVGYGPGGGRLRLFMLVFILIGSVLYFLLLSKVMNKILEFFADFLGFIFRCLLMPFKWAGLAAKKVKETVINVFLYLSKWYIIYNRVSIPLVKRRNIGKRRREASHETKEGRYYYKDRYSDIDRLRYGLDDQSSHKGQGSRSRKGRTDTGGRGQSRRKRRVELRNSAYKRSADN
ncbi:MAG: hypothetical protein GX111_04205 [Clostridiales bacterium]|nr:hypothetical protein [Clostridiales bacterium]